MMPKTKGIPGINIQWPISEMILSGRKTIETRRYPIPEKHLGRTIAIIETPGPRGKRAAGITKARIVGTIVFKGCFKYRSREHWLSDRERHCVQPDDPHFGYSDNAEKWGWEIERVSKLAKPKTPPKTRGIIFATDCRI